jgi:hypothetical protein
MLTLLLELYGMTLNNGKIMGFSIVSLTRFDLTP